jgi:hypothetical protein
VQRGHNLRRLRHSNSEHQAGASRPTESVISVVLRNYDGQGNISQIDNVKGSITGIVSDRQGSGTYEVSPDCTGIRVGSGRRQ